MTGFVLGTTDGATLGDDSGGTLGTGPRTYLLDGQPIPRLVDEVATHDTLTLLLRVTRDDLVTHLRPLKSDEEQVDTLVTDDGGYTAVDRADGGNTYRLTPPATRQPLRQAGDYHVARYEEDMVSQSTDEWGVEVEFVPSADRTDAPAISIQQQVTQPTEDYGGTFGQSSGFTLGGSAGTTLGTRNANVAPPDHWTFATRYGHLVTDRVDAEFLGTGADGVERFEVVMRLTHDQTHVWEAALSRLGGVRVREIPDATNRAVDDTDNDANTVAVTPPDADTVVTAGDYVITSWESTRLNEGWQSVSAEVARKG